MSDLRVKELLAEWEALALSAPLESEAPRPRRGVSGFGISSAAIAIVVLFVALWARDAMSPTVPVGGGVGSEPSTGSSVPVTAEPTSVASLLPHPGGTCSAGQLALEKAESQYASSTVLTTRLLVSQPLRNTGAGCALSLPRIIGLAAVTGPFETVNVINGGLETCVKAPGASVDRECTFGYPTSFTIRSGESVKIVLNVSWWSAGQPHSAMSPAPPPCAHAINDITRAQFPLASGTIEFGWDIRMDEVCLEPASLSVSIIDQPT